ncbi:hypothetical protein [Rhodococcus jostii]|nr:hypothetical protein [Rhodococcus jostii]
MVPLDRSAWNITLVLRAFMSTDNNGVPAIIWHDTYRQLTGDLWTP